MANSVLSAKEAGGELPLVQPSFSEDAVALTGLVALLQNGRDVLSGSFSDLRDEITTRTINGGLELARLAVGVYHFAHGTLTKCPAVKALSRPSQEDRDKGLL